MGGSVCVGGGADNYASTQPFPGESPGGKFQHFHWKLELRFPLTLIKKYVSAAPSSPPPCATPVIHEFRGTPPRSTAAVAFPCTYPGVSAASPREAWGQD